MLEAQIGTFSHCSLIHRITAELFKHCAAGDQSDGDRWPVLRGGACAEGCFRAGESGVNIGIMLMPSNPSSVPTVRNLGLLVLQTINWLRHDVTPIGVAEGLPPAEKLAKLQARCMALYGFARSSAAPAYGDLQRTSQLACDLLHAMV